MIFCVILIVPNNMLQLIVISVHLFLDSLDEFYFFLQLFINFKEDNITCYIDKDIVII